MTARPDSLTTMYLPLKSAISSDTGSRGASVSRGMGDALRDSAACPGDYPVRLFMCESDRVRRVADVPADFVVRALPPHQRQGELRDGLAFFFRVAFELASGGRNGATDIVKAILPPRIPCRCRLGQH